MSSSIIDAKILKKSSEQREVLKKETNDILRTLSDDIMKAKQSYQNNVMTTMPITFTIPGLSNKDAQRIIWNSVLKELNEKNYRVRLNPTKNKCWIKIIWISKEEEEIIKEQMNFIASHVDKSLGKN